MPEQDPADAASDAEQVAANDLEKQTASRLWLVAAGLCLSAAAALWLLSRADAAFVVAALGVVAWFFNVRAELRRKNGHRETEPRREAEDEDEGGEWRG